MVHHDPEPMLLRARAAKNAIEEQHFNRSVHDREIFAKLPWIEQPAFMRDRLDKEALGYWSMGFAACGLRPHG